MVSRQSAERPIYSESHADVVPERLYLQWSDSWPSGTDVRIGNIGNWEWHEHVHSIPGDDGHGYRDHSTSIPETVKPRRRSPSRNGWWSAAGFHFPGIPGEGSKYMRYQNRYPKTMSGAEIRILNRWQDPINGLGVNGGRSRSLTDGQTKRIVVAVKSALKESRRTRRQQSD